MVEVYTELQVLFQNKLVGQKQIFDFHEKSKVPQFEEHQNSLNIQQLQITERSMTKKSIVKYKSNNKNSALP